MNKTILILYLLITSIALFSQSEVTFEYDGAGNRTGRTIEFELKSEEIPSDSSGSLASTTLPPHKNVGHEYKAQVDKLTIHIYPNPNTGIFKISIEGWDNSTNAHAKICTASGKTISEQKLSSPATTMDFNNQPDGFYLLTVNINGKEETWKIIKR